MGGKNTYSQRLAIFKKKFFKSCTVMFYQFRKSFSKPYIWKHWRRVGIIWFKGSLVPRLYFYWEILVCIALYSCQFYSEYLQNGKKYKEPKPLCCVAYKSALRIFAVIFGRNFQRQTFITLWERKKKLKFCSKKSKFTFYLWVLLLMV